MTEAEAYALLNWYFCDYEAAVGIRGFDPSSVGCGSGGDPEAAMIAARGAIRRGKKIQDVMSVLPGRTQEVLRLVHEQRRWPKNDIPDDLRGIVCTFEYDKRGRSRIEWARGMKERAHQAFCRTAKLLGVQF